MAYIEGYPGRYDAVRTKRHLWLILIACATLVGLAAWSACDQPQGDQGIGWAVLGVIFLLMTVVSLKLNAKGWKRFLAPARYARDLAGDTEVADHLAELDDAHFVMHDFTFEFFHVHHLVVSPLGIFVVARLPSEAELSVHNNVLFAGRESLEDLAGRMWRICHLVNIIVHKGFQLQIMPQPILVCAAGRTPEIGTFDGIRILPLDALNREICSAKQETMRPEETASIAGYIARRYVQTK
ncbi:NERD domain-containing protein [Desulfovermiculus halophilus]|jgi:hypothetical protein|uniref:NERD domain-containing protein n=1 Tax=Desulfovermiculus halophilus TaxID=339722 RepID=UPI000489ABF8|nr:NERD domain-containing protein [Desulfovermiculus halophilus]